MKPREQADGGRPGKAADTVSPILALSTEGDVRRLILLTILVGLLEWSSFEAVEPDCCGCLTMGWWFCDKLVLQNHCVTTMRRHLLWTIKFPGVLPA